jgi:septal ring factor EnvC (AmiA/AmiB activator)
MLMLMTSRLSLLFLLACAGAGAHAADTVIYKCVDENGRIEFTDSPKRNCKVLDLPGAISSSAAAPRRAAAPVRAAAAPAATPSDFPRVDGAQQRARDDDRRGILNDELRSEEKKLAELRRDFNNGEPERQGNERNYAKYQERVVQMRDSIGRAEKNIDALKREIANIR